MEHILNVSAYRFVSVQDTAALQARVLERAQTAGLQGTVLIAEEGLNLALAGPVTGLRAFLDWLQADPRFAALPIKESLSAQMPFRKLRVKVKRGSTKPLPGAFIGNKGRTVFRRVGKKRLPIEPVQTIDVAQMFNTRRINEVVLATINARLPEIFEREAAFYLQRFNRG